MELKRRDFLKITGLLGAGFFGKVNINEPDPYNVWKPIIPDQLERTETFCPLCESFCKLEVLKKRELIFGIFKTGETKGICPKIAAYHNVIYSEGRIKTPLLRVKERGVFAFKPIDYDKAFQILREKMAKGGEFYTDAIATGEFERFYLSSISKKINFYPDARVKALFGAEKVFFDIENASLVVNFGNDLLYDGYFIERANFLAENAKKVVTISPFITKGTALGEKWYPAKLSELSDIIKNINDFLAGKIVAPKKPYVPDIVKRIKSTKSVCLVFSPLLLEREEGVAIAKEVFSLATQLKVINKEGGIYFYNSSTTSKPFNIFNENVNNYFVYNIDPTLLYPIKETDSKLKSIPFIVYMGHHHSDISLYADLVLPLPFFVERKEVYAKKEGRGFKLIKAEQAILGGLESQELRRRENIEVIFQKLLNFKAPYGIKDIEDVSRILKPSLPAREAYLGSLERKLIGGGVVSPKLSYNETMYFGNKDLELMLVAQNVLDFKNQGSKWAEEMDSRNPIFMNSQTAAKFHISRKDKIVVKTPVGSIKGKVFIFEGIADDTLAVNRFKKKMVLGTPYKIIKVSKDKETKLIWWKDENYQLEALLSYSNKSYNVPIFNNDKIEIIKG